MTEEEQRLRWQGYQDVNGRTLHRDQPGAMHWIDASAARRRARKLVMRAVASGKMMRPGTCSICGAGGRKIEAHHNDYSKPMDVEWLCAPCHLWFHRLA